MSIYQRYLSKSLIFFSIFFVIFFLFLESNMGFKWILNLTSRVFIGFKAEEVSGNWRDFTLKNIKYDIFGVSIQANSIHVILDVESLFKKSTIFKEVETKNLIFSFQKNISKNVDIKNISDNLQKTNGFFKYAVIFQKIHADQILFKTPKANIFFLNVFSGMRLINNNIIISPTYINAIQVISKNINFNKKFIKNKKTLINKVEYSKKICNILHFFSNKPKIFIPLKINLILLKCKKINFLNDQRDNLFKIELKAKVENNILKIKKIHLDSSFVKIQSYGQVIFNNDYSISFFIKNKILLSKFQNKIIKFLFKAHLNNKLKFKIKANNLYKINMHGSILLDNLDYPFQIELKSKNLLWSIKKDFIFKLNSFNGMFRGTINNYSVCLKNIFSIKGIPKTFIIINGRGNLKNIFLRKIKFFSIEKKRMNKKIINLQKNIRYSNYIELIGKINVTGKYNNNTYNLCIPKIQLDTNVMRKKISILGSLKYKKFNFLEIPGINLLAGNNNLYLKGSLGERYNVHSFLHADNLDYFSPNLKGKVKAKLDFYGNYEHPHLISKISAKNFNWNNIYLKSIRTFTTMNVKKKFLGKILVDAKKIHLSNFHIDSLHIQTHWNNQKQKFWFLLKSRKVYINLILNGIIDYKTGSWYGFFKKINIQTFLGKIDTKKSLVVHYLDSNNNINHFYKKNMRVKDAFSDFLYKTQTSFFKIFNQSFLNFNSKLSINSKVKWTLGEKFPDGKIFLTGTHITLEKKIAKKIFFKNIDYFRLSVHLIKNTVKSNWVMRTPLNEFKYNSIIGYLNIIDIYDKKNIEGRFSTSNFPVSFINFFTTDFEQVKGIFKSHINIFGTLYRPKVSSNVHFKNVFIRSDNLLKYITLFFPYFLGKTDSIRINQEVIMQKGNILFTLDSFFKNPNNIRWNLLFSSKKIEVVIFPKIKIKFSSQLNLHYVLSKYDLIGYINFPLFHFRINEKNFIF